jgi:zinc transporter ZupT
LILRALSAGVILCLALVHVIADGYDCFALVSDYAIAAGNKAGGYGGYGPCCVIFGILSMVVTENLMQHFTARSPSISSSKKENDKCLEAAASGGTLDDNDSVPETPRERQLVIAYMAEAGCVTHSFLVGFALGVQTSDRNAVMALFIALVFHQWLEAIGLGSILVNARFSLRKSCFMIFSYALTTPVGTAIGIAVSTTYDPESVTNNAVQGEICIIECST